MTGLYSDFLEAAAYRDANGGLGLPYLSPGDIAARHQWNLTATSTTTLPNVSGTVTAAQLPGFILSDEPGRGRVPRTPSLQPTPATAASPMPPSARRRVDAMEDSGAWPATALHRHHRDQCRNAQQSDHHRHAEIGFIMQLGNDTGYTVTLNGTNTYTGGTTILAGDLIVASDASLGAAPPLTNAQFNPASMFNAEGFPTNALRRPGRQRHHLQQPDRRQRDADDRDQRRRRSNTFTTSRPIAVGGEAATINVNGNIVTLDGPLVSLGMTTSALGNADGDSDLTIDDLSANERPPDADPVDAKPVFLRQHHHRQRRHADRRGDERRRARQYDGSDPDWIGTIELNGGTLQTGASFSASERNIVLDGGSQIDVDGNTTSLGHADRREAHDRDRQQQRDRRRHHVQQLHYFTDGDVAARRFGKRHDVQRR